MARGGGGGSRGGSHGGGFSSHSRSGGSRSSGSSRSSRSGGFSSHTRSGSSYRSSSARRSSGPRAGGAGGSGGIRFGRGGFFGGGYRGSAYGGGGGGCSGGCLTTILVFAIFIIFGIFSFEGGLGESGSGSSTTVTVQRKKLSDGLCEASDAWYQDDWGDWIKSGNTLVSGLEYFYGKTGVQPYLWITGAADGAAAKSESAVESLALRKYNELFSDNGHLVFVFREYPNDSGDYITTVYAAADAELVMDAEAREILLDCVDSYYEDDSLSDEEFFAKSFRRAADRIMAAGSTVSTGGTDDGSLSAGMKRLLFAFALALIVFVVFYRLFKKRMKKGADSAAESTGTGGGYSQNGTSAGKTANTAYGSGSASAGSGSTASTEKDAAFSYTTITCPHCGASVRIVKGRSGTCSYCGSEVSER